MKNNFVAKHARKTNKAIIFKDKKKAVKRGECKHKNHIHKNHKQVSEHYSIAA